MGVASKQDRRKEPRRQADKECEKMAAKALDFAMQAQQQADDARKEAKDALALATRHNDECLLVNQQNSTRLEGIEGSMRDIMSVLSPIALLHEASVKEKAERAEAMERIKNFLTDTLRESVSGVLGKLIQLAIAAGLVVLLGQLFGESAARFVGAVMKFGVP